MENRFSWVVRFDVAPEWVADGFVMTDEIALDMLSDKLSFANMDTELAAQVIVAPPAMRIAIEQGYGAEHVQHNNICESVMVSSPMAYRLTKGAVLDDALNEAIKLLDSVAFVRDANDNTGDVLAKLRAAHALVRGEEASDDVGDESHHSHINGGDI